MSDNENSEEVNGSREVSNEESNELPQSLFVQHLATYPAIIALTGLISSFPVIKIFTSNAIPLMMAARIFTVPDPVIKRASPVARRVDQIGDGILTRVDGVFPGLQTFEPRSVRDYANLPIGTVSSTEGFVKNNFVQPIKTVTHAVRIQYSRVYDTQGKALIRSRFDPIVSPVNDQIENFIGSYLPNGDEFPVSDNLSNELSRTWRLARCAVRRARPVVSQRRNELLQLPHVATEHVKETYQAKVIKHSSGETPSITAYALACLGTTRELSGEILSPITYFSSGSTQDPGNEDEDENNSNDQQQQSGVVSRVANLFSSLIPGRASSPASNGAPTADVQDVSAQGVVH